ncbi:MAG: ribosomal protein S18-alanine N-acetyltransferase [Armatimonadetes bacterium]|nr:ribosomal protein S18-alanine N-acetyltransferase [Armatimonadota bacterium]
MTSGSAETTWLDEITVAPMAPADLDEVLVIERHSFPSAWSKNSYERELRNRSSYYFAARHEDRLVGYIGMWVVVDEAHITTLAVHPGCRRRGLGSHLLRLLIEHACQRGATRVTLEVREQNLAAIAMYRAFGFQQTGVLHGYYGDTGENGLVMWKVLSPVGEGEATP